MSRYRRETPSRETITHADCCCCCSTHKTALPDTMRGDRRHREMSEEDSYFFLFFSSRDITETRKETHAIRQTHYLSRPDSFSLSSYSSLLTLHFLLSLLSFPSFPFLLAIPSLLPAFPRSSCTTRRGCLYTRAACTLVCGVVHASWFAGIVNEDVETALLFTAATLILEYLYIVRVLLSIYMHFALSNVAVPSFS